MQRAAWPPAPRDVADPGDVAAWPVKLDTRRIFTGSAALVKTIGMIEVEALAASAQGWSPVQR